MDEVYDANSAAAVSEVVYKMRMVLVVVRWDSVADGEKDTCGRGREERAEGSDAASVGLEEEPTQH